jgi:7-carboxy-7-deazaguanine synthase
MIRVNEMFCSLQGESSFSGVPCFFIRLSGCNLRCSYCDTAYAFAEGRDMAIEAILGEVAEAARRWGGVKLSGHLLPLVEVTGGEPLAQKETPELLRRLCDGGYTVLLETNGSLELDEVDDRVIKIVDMKAPSSGESSKNLPGILEKLKGSDEVKFVLGSREDYDWMKDFLRERPWLAERCTVAVSWCDMTRAAQGQGVKPVPAGHHPVCRRWLAEAILRDCLPVRMQVQLHKILWEETERGR